MEPVKTKSATNDPVIRSSLVTLVITASFAVAPSITSILVRHFPSNARDIEDIGQAIQVIASITGLTASGACAAGRIAMGDLYTAKGLPGPDKDSVVPISTQPTQPLPPPPSPPDFKPIPNELKPELSVEESSYQRPASKYVPKTTTNISTDPTKAI